MSKAFKIAFTAAARIHVKEIAAWYNLKQKGLGKRFREQLQAELALVRKNPFTRSCRYADVRFAVPKNFPYAAHYIVNEDMATVVVHAVFAFKQDPGEHRVK
jgi:hypothetical protein